MIKKTSTNAWDWLLTGVLNVLPGFGERAGHALTHHPRVHALAFTGSGAVGRLVMRASAASNLKRVTLELVHPRTRTLTRAHTHAYAHAHALTHHPRIHALAFTGSGAVGSLVLRAKVPTHSHRIHRQLHTRTEYAHTERG